MDMLRSLFIGEDKRPVEPFPVMNLPAELREIIWAYAIVDAGPVEIHKLHKSDWHLYADPPLTKVSRLVREESLPVFYSQNCFNSPFHLDLLWFLRKLDKPRLGMLRIVLYRTPASSMSFLRQLKQDVDILIGKGMRADAFKVLIHEKSEGEVWCAMGQIEEFEETKERKIMRRIMTAQTH